MKKNQSSTLELITQIKPFALSLLLTAGLVSPTLFAGEVIRHTITKGDTLWDISETYLDKPWLWPEIWEQNNDIENPHLIYPKDVLLISASSIRLIRSNELKVEKKSPEVRQSELDSAITTIDPSAISPFLTQSVVVDDNRLEEAGYVLQGTRGEIILGKGVEFFANGIEGTAGQRFQLFKIGRPINDVKTGESYGVEGVHLGSAVIVETGDVTRLYITQSNQEIRPGDRITPILDPTALPRYFPRKPDAQLETYVTMIPRGVAEAGRRDIAVIVGGKNRGFEPGHVLLVYSDTGQVKDPITGEVIQLPPIEIGTVMVFQVHEKVSYVILMNSTDPIKLGDTVASPYTTG
ncbi:MAG: LysM repeat protein [Saprospiraceae bacterium]|jgi:LysM repeat protein